jgi:hypothetical protein
MTASDGGGAPSRISNTGCIATPVPAGIDLVMVPPIVGGSSPFAAPGVLDIQSARPENGGGDDNPGNDATAEADAYLLPVSLRIWRRLRVYPGM